MKGMGFNVESGTDVGGVQGATVGSVLTDVATAVPLGLRQGLSEVGSVAYTYLNPYNYVSGFDNPATVSRVNSRDYRPDGGYNTVAGDLTHGISQFMSVFIPTGAVANSLRLTQSAGKVATGLKAAAAANTSKGGYKLVTTALNTAAGTTKAVTGTAIGRSALAGVPADFLAFSETETRLSNLIKDMNIPVLSGTVGYFLAAEDDDSFLKGRLKNVAEGGILGVIADSALMAFGKAAKKLRNKYDLPEAKVDDKEIAEAMVDAQKEAHDAAVRAAMASAGVTNWNELVQASGGRTIVTLPGDMAIEIGGKQSAVTATVDLKNQNQVVNLAFAGRAEHIDSLLQFAKDTKNNKLANLIHRIKAIPRSSTWRATKQAEIDAADAATAARDSEKRSAKQTTALARTPSPEEAERIALEVNAGLRPSSDLKPIVEADADAAIPTVTDAVNAVDLVDPVVDSAAFRQISVNHSAYEDDVLQPLLAKGAIDQADAAVIRSVYAASDMWFQRAGTLSADAAPVQGAFGSVDLRSGNILINGKAVRDAKTRRPDTIRALKGATVVLHETTHMSLHRLPPQLQTAAKLAHMEARETGYIRDWVEAVYGDIPGDAKSKLTDIFESDMDEFLAEYTAISLTRKGVEQMPAGYLNTISDLLANIVKTVIEKIRALTGGVPNKTLDELSEILGGLKESPNIKAAMDRQEAFRKMQLNAGVESAQAMNRAARETEQLTKPLSEAEKIQAKFDEQDMDTGGKYPWKRKSIDPEAKPAEQTVTIDLSILADRLKGRTKVTDEDVEAAITFVGGKTVESLSNDNIKTLVAYIDQFRDLLSDQRAYVSNKLSQAIAANAAVKAGPDNRVISAGSEEFEYNVNAITGVNDARRLPNSSVSILGKALIKQGLNAGERAFKAYSANPKNPEAEKVLLKTLATVVNNVNLMSKLRNEAGRMLQSFNAQPEGVPRLGQFGAEEQIARLRSVIDEMTNDPEFLRPQKPDPNVRMSVDPEQSGSPKPEKKRSLVTYEQLSESSQMAVREAHRQIMTMVNSPGFDVKQLQNSAWNDSLKLSPSERIVLGDLLQSQVDGVSKKSRQATADSLFKEIMSEVKDATPETAAFVRNVLDMDNLDKDSLNRLFAMVEASSKQKAKWERTLKALRNGDATAFDMYMEAWMNAILSGPRTFSTNIISSALATVARPAEILIGGTVTGNMSAMSQGIQEYVSLIHTLFDVIKGADATEKYLTTYQSIAKTFKSGVNEFDAASGVFDYKPQAIPGKFGQLIRLPMRGIAATDELFKQLNIRSMLRSRAIREFNRLGKPIEELDGYIRQFMEEAFEPGTGRLGMDPFTERVKHADLYTATNAVTFTEELDANLDWVSHAGLAISNAASSFKPIRLILPFVRTPTNILRKTLALTPFAPTMKSFRDRFMGRMGEAEKAKAIGEMVLGGAVIGVAVAAAASGAITGYGPRNQNERRLWLDSGAKPYSFRIPDGKGGYTYIEYRKFDPVATHMGMVADLVDYIQSQEALGDAGAAEHGENILQAMVFAVVSNVTNKSYMIGVRDFMDATTDLTDSGTLERYIAQRGLASHVPAAVGSIPGFDDYTKELHGMMDQLFNRLPGVQQTLPPRRNVLGEPIENPNLRRLIPASVSTQENDPVMQELLNIGYGFQRVPYTFKGVDFRNFKNKEGRQAYDRMSELVGTVKIGGNTLRETLEAMFADPRYQELPNPIGVNDHENVKVRAIQSVMQQYRSRARAITMQEFPEVTQQILDNSRLANPSRDPKGPQAALSKL